MFHNLTCKSESLIYLPNTVCANLNNHRKEVKSQASLLACKHFNEQNHNFQQHAQFTLIALIQKQTTTEES